MNSLNTISFKIILLLCTPASLNGGDLPSCHLPLSPSWPLGEVPLYPFYFKLDSCHCSAKEGKCLFLREQYERSLMNAPCKRTQQSQTETYKELLTLTKMPTLYNRRLQDIAILMYKVKYGTAPGCVSEFFTIKSTHQRLRKCDFELTRFDTVAYERYSLRYQRPFISRSKVSSDLKNLTSLKAFKKHIRGVDLSSHVDNNSNCCDLCKFWIAYICI